ncbi:MAG: ADP-forming succinate--CoA ligase subunit beta [Anaerolineae bacterium]|nr:ADP-forming succinate--CoA ligase subunit beta [Anaerolineae bacterium]
MMLLEYQTKSIFSNYDIPIPRGRLAFSALDAKLISEELRGQVVIKAQVLSSGRGKAGGVRLAKNPEEAESLAAKILGMEIRGLKVRKILVDEGVDIRREVYLGISLDRSKRCPILLVSGAGGGDIEEMARYTPEKLVRETINPLTGLHDFQINDLASRIDLPRDLWPDFVKISQSLWQIYQDKDALTVEINPLVITADNRFLALDGKMYIDDNALYRHAEIVQFKEIEGEEEIEAEARKYGFSYVKLSGNIGCAANGAGLAMATMDTIQLWGGKPANFLDIGGGASPERVTAALDMIMSNSSVQVVLINIISAITRCDEVVKGILSSVKASKVVVPVIVRLAGENSEDCLNQLKEAKILTAESLNEAVKMAISFTRG